MGQFRLFGKEPEHLGSGCVKQGKAKHSRWASDYRLTTYTFA